MFALRASSSSTYNAARRCTRLVMPLSQSSRASLTDQTTVASFLEEPDSEPGMATPFNIAEPPQMDGPPTAAGGFYPKANLMASSGSKHISSAPAGRQDLPEYKLHCHSSRNNTIVTFAKPNGSTIAWCSGGSTEDKFRKANRSSYEAGYKCAQNIFKKIQDHYHRHENFKLELFFKGFGEGREAMKVALLASENEAIRSLVCRVTDRTPIKIGGTRAKKARRG